MSDFHPEWFGGNTHAATLIDDLCYIAHVWDDLVDQDKAVAPSSVDKAFRIALVNIPINPFYQEHHANLISLIHVGVLGFITANKMEVSGDPHQIEIAHGLRYTVAQVCVYAISVTNPPEALEEILPQAWLAMMPERFADYAKEHGHGLHR